MPMCPLITATAEGADALFDAAQDAGADFIEPGGLTLRPGRQKDFFLSQVLAPHYPELQPLYADIYGENRKSGMPRNIAGEPIMAAWDRNLVERGMPQLIPHRVYRELLSPPDSLFVLFCHMQSLYSARGVDTRPLKAATKVYADWLSAERTALRRKRITLVPSDPFPVTRALTDKLACLCETDRFASLIGNEKLARLASQIIAGGGYFDYPTLTVLSAP